MTRHFVTTLAMVFAVAAMNDLQVLAHEGHDHKVMGTVTMAAADHVMLKTTDAKDVTVLITKDTKVTLNKQAVKPQDLKVGTRIVITAVEEHKVMKAKTIQVSAEPPVVK